jgi:hypothetical protein
MKESAAKRYETLRLIKIIVAQRAKNPLLSRGLSVKNQLTHNNRQEYP